MPAKAVQVIHPYLITTIRAGLTRAADCPQRRNDRDKGQADKCKACDTHDQPPRASPRNQTISIAATAATTAALARNGAVRSPLSPA